jgi:hypothetical protein
MFDPPNTTSRLIAVFVIFAMFAVSLGESAHSFLFDHEVCAEHGDLIHSHGEAEVHHDHEHAHHEQKIHAQTGQDDETGALPKATELVGHDHCSLCILARDEQVLEVSRVDGNFVTLATQARLLCFPVTPSVPQIALLHRAPKTAPPQFGI